jgi:hypothetical protein
MKQKTKSPVMLAVVLTSAEMHEDTRESKHPLHMPESLQRLIREAWEVHK